jgi:hypothetical protein
LQDFPALLQDFPALLQALLQEFFLEKVLATVARGRGPKWRGFRRKIGHLGTREKGVLQRGVAKSFLEKTSCNSGARAGRGAAPQAPRSAGENRGISSCSKGNLLEI